MSLGSGRIRSGSHGPPRAETLNNSTAASVGLTSVESSAAAISAWAMCRDESVRAYESQHARPDDDSQQHFHDDDRNSSADGQLGEQRSNDRDGKDEQDGMVAERHVSSATAGSGTSRTTL
jgi:hypothetical protein